MGNVCPKQFLGLGDRPILIRSLETFLESKLFHTIILTSPSEHLDQTNSLLQEYGLAQDCKVVVGGVTRQASVKAGLDTLPSAVTHVLVHDGVRPLVSSEIVESCLSAAKQHGAAIVAVQVKDTLKSVEGNQVKKTIDRSNLWRAQTPQAASLDLLRKAYAEADKQRFCGTDEASLLELIKCPVEIVNGSETNIKITLPEDIPMAEALMAQKNDSLSGSQFRTGHGYDAHRLVKDRKLVLGGVTIPHEKGLLGHSDADVVTHALCDALLGAIGAGDIGRHFPDSDPQYKGINSLQLLGEVFAKVASHGMQVVNADLTVIAQQPKLAKYLAQMQENLASACQAKPSAINIKATTTENMGFAGREEGIACHAVVLLARRQPIYFSPL